MPLLRRAKRRERSDVDHSHPLAGWPNSAPVAARLASFSIAKYGAQTDRDWHWMPDAGNGISSSTGRHITGNDPNDANAPSNSYFQQQWAATGELWGGSSNGGLRYYIIDNEPESVARNASRCASHRCDDG
jgi:hypothetical protein